jgi:hypothetical protein
MMVMASVVHRTRSLGIAAQLKMTVMMMVMVMVVVVVVMMVMEMVVVVMVEFISQVCTRTFTHMYDISNYIY